MPQHGRRGHAARGRAAALLRTSNSWPQATVALRQKMSVAPATMGAMGRKPSDDYAPGEPGKWGEPYEMIDYVEGDEEDDSDDEDS